MQPTAPGPTMRGARPYRSSTYRGARLEVGTDPDIARTPITLRVRAPKRRHSHCLPGVGFSRCQNSPRSRSPIISGRLRHSPRPLRVSQRCPQPRTRRIPEDAPQRRAASRPRSLAPVSLLQGCIPLTPTLGHIRFASHRDPVG